ncbi:MAG: DUF2235 domain-containing protein [Betaproteobacteria bacterium]|nr:DUF2235 domain-containing protein [Betaproteobacteria bacterium]
MSKVLAFLADGTWNGPDQDENEDGLADMTNVLKLFCCLHGAQTLDTVRLQDEQELRAATDGTKPAQVAKYIHGVGDSRNPLMRLLGGVFGAGIIQRIVRGYTFISRNYEPGDRIFLVGFSRGAYTARAVGGLITKVGLLDARKLSLDDKIDGYRYGVSAWVKYRRVAGKVDAALDELELTEAKAIPADAIISDVPIKAIGVWDTVGSLGLPLYVGDNRYDLFKFADGKLSTKVARGIHALSIDERRGDFVPTVWESASNVTQAGFIGAHADVGGGYHERGLSDIALGWMSGELGKAGLQMMPTPIYQIEPHRLQDMHEPWTEGVFKFGVNKPREFKGIDSMSLHDTVRLRVAGLTDYRPRSLINSGFMSADGKFSPGVKFVT